MWIDYWGLWRENICSGLNLRNLYSFNSILFGILINILFVQEIFLAFLIFLFFVFLTVPRDYSWLCAHDSFLTVLKISWIVQRLNWSLTHAKQVLNSLYYLPSSFYPAHFWSCPIFYLSSLIYIQPRQAKWIEN